MFEGFFEGFDAVNTKSPAPLIAEWLRNYPGSYPNGESSYFTTVSQSLSPLHQKANSSAMFAGMEVRRTPVNPTDIAAGVTELKKFGDLLDALLSKGSARDLQKAVKDFFAVVLKLQSLRLGAAEDEKEVQLMKGMVEGMSKCDLPVVYFRQRLFNGIKKYAETVKAGVDSKIIEEIKKLILSEKKDMPALAEKVKAKIELLTDGEKKQKLIEWVNTGLENFHKDREVFPYEPTVGDAFGKVAAKAREKFGAVVSTVSASPLFNKDKRASEAMGSPAGGAKSAITTDYESPADQRKRVDECNQEIAALNDENNTLNQEMQTKKELAENSVTTKLATQRATMKKITSEARLELLEKEYYDATDDAEKAKIVEDGVKIKFYFRVINFFLSGIVNFFFRMIASELYQLQQQQLRGYFENQSNPYLKLAEEVENIEANKGEFVIPPNGANKVTGAIKNYAKAVKRRDVDLPAELKSLEDERKSLLLRLVPFAKGHLNPAEIAEVKATAEGRSMFRVSGMGQ